MSRADLPGHSVLRAILWLQWKLWRRRWERENAFLKVIGVLRRVLAIPIAILSFSITFFISIQFASLDSMQPIAIEGIVLCLAYLYIRIMGLWMSLQQSDGLALDQMLHLPIHFRSVLVLNFTLAQLTFSNVLFIPAFIGYVIACTLFLDVSNLVLIAVILSFVLCVAALLHQFHAWLVSSVVNKSRRMSFAYLLFFVVVLAVQIPNFYFTFTNKQNETEPAHAVIEDASAPSDSSTGQSVSVPGQESDTSIAEHEPQTHWSHGWISSGKQDEFVMPWWSVSASFGFLLLGLLSLNRNYRSFVARYRDGHQPRQRRTATVTTGVARPKRTSIARNQTVSIAQVTLKSWIRSPYGKLTLLSPLFFLFVIPLIWMNNPGILNSQYLPLLALGVVALAGTPTTLSCNIFAFDRLGFGLYVFSGVNLNHLVLGKCGALFVPFFVYFAVILSLCLLVGSIGFSYFIATIFQCGVVFTINCILGVFWSVRHAYGVSLQSMKSQSGASANFGAFLLELLVVLAIVGLAWLTLSQDRALNSDGMVFPLFLVVSFAELVIAIGFAVVVLHSLTRSVANRVERILERIAVSD